jgi:snoRNA binding domain, fibrillarin
VAETVLIRGGGRLFLVTKGRPVGEGTRLLSDQLADDGSLRLPPWLTDAVRGSGEIVAADSVLQTALDRAGISASIADFEVLRGVRERLPALDPKEERLFLLTLARHTVERILASPEEVLISLAREEERVERAARREENAAHQFLGTGSVVLQGYVIEWEKFRTSFREHHQSLERRLEEIADRVVPNLTAIVGARVAARLVAQAGGVAPLASMSASRLQLLGSRRRPAGGRGPRFGILYRAVRMAEVPPDRQGAFARTLAAEAAIAVRADWSTHRSIAELLLRRRDRRIAQLQRN